MGLNLVWLGEELLLYAIRVLVSGMWLSDVFSSLGIEREEVQDIDSRDLALGPGQVDSLCGFLLYPYAGLDCRGVLS